MLYNQSQLTILIFLPQTVYVHTVPFLHFFSTILLSEKDNFTIHYKSFKTIYDIRK